MKNQSKKLMGYSAAAGSILLSGAAVEDKIYYDIDPDFVFIAEESYDHWFHTHDLDVNNDDIIDFRLRLVASFAYTGWGASSVFHHGDLYPVGSNEVFIDESTTLNMCKAGWFEGVFNYVGMLNSGQTVSPSPGTGFFTSSSGVIDRYSVGVNQNLFFRFDKSYWGASADCSDDYPLLHIAGNWAGEENQFAAILFHKDGNEYPGWVRLSVGGINEITLHDFAIGLEAGGTIQAGDTSNSIIGAPPALTTTTNITDISAKLKWSGVPGALQYKIRYRPIGSPIWNYVNTSSLKKKINSLICGTSYEWQVKAHVYNSPLFFSFWSDVATFTTVLCRLGNDSMPDDELFITVSPNPASEFLQVMLDGEYDGATIELRNLAGQLVLSKLADDEIITLGIQDIPSGVYMLQVLHEGKTYTDKVIVNN